MQQGAVPPERAQEVLDGILGRTEFQEPETYGMQLMREVLEWIGDLFSGIGGSLDPALVEGGLRVLWILAVALSGLGLVSYALALWRSRSPGADMSVHFFVPASMATGVVKWSCRMSGSARPFSNAVCMSQPAFMASATKRLMAWS